MVAMLGWIMPAPLATPTMRQRWPASAKLACATLGPTSVVRMACEKASMPPGERRVTASGSASRTFLSGRTTPMTPVEATKISLSSQRSSSAARARVRRAASRPSRPVTAFAQPALTTTPFTRPPLFFSADFDSTTGAARNLLRVKTAAALAPSAATISPRSGRFLRMPARTPEARNPFGSFMSVADCGLRVARGRAALLRARDRARCRRRRSSSPARRPRCDSSGGARG